MMILGFCRKAFFDHIIAVTVSNYAFNPLSSKTLKLQSKVLLKFYVEKCHFETLKEKNFYFQATGVGDSL